MKIYFYIILFLLLQFLFLSCDKYVMQMF